MCLLPYLHERWSRFRCRGIPVNCSPLYLEERSLSLGALPGLGGGKNTPPPANYFLFLLLLSIDSSSSAFEYYQFIKPFHPFVCRVITVVCSVVRVLSEALCDIDLTINSSSFPTLPRGLENSKVLSIPLSIFLPTFI